MISLKDKSNREHREKTEDSSMLRRMGRKSRLFMVKLCTSASNKDGQVAVLVTHK